MVCSDCGGENRKNARFCSWCGVRVALRCAVCATDIVPGAEFCDACGTPVGEPADAPAPLGARKVVTVMFADLAGSTAQHERMDPEAVRGFMDAYYAAMRSAVEDEGGRVVKLMGDGVMAAFGVPRVAEDDATRAVRAGAAMQDAFARLADRALQQFGTPVALRVGINTGEVVVAVGDNDVVGDAVNVAARLESAAAPGEIVVGENTWRLVRDTLTLEALEPLEVKGKAEPVRAFRLLSLDPPAATTPAGTTFVGRDAELARLVAFFDDAVAAAVTRVVAVIGSPGVGKSRLSRELAATLTPRATVLEAGCPPAGGSTFGPVIDLLRGVASADDLVGTLSGGAPATPEEVFAAVRRVFTTLAIERPLVVVLDDIQWAEPMLLDLIEHLAEWGRDAPVLLVTLARPELRDIRPALAEGGRRVAGVIVLEGLGGEASQQLARDLLGAGDLPAAVAGRLLAVTEGNPLFLRELVRMLVDDGVLVRSGDAWTTSVDAADLDVPPTVHALLSARIERLDADERIVLERAAVIGSQFPRGGVAAIAPSTLGSELDRHLETLRRRELVEPEGSYWGDEPLYRFHHVLIRDAAYRGLLREARADLHERYADWLEKKLGDGAAEQAEVLGFHLERAHEERQQITGESAPELGTRAAHWLAIAGRRALERDDVGAAAGLLGRALDRATDDDPDRPSLLIDRAEAVLAAGDVTTGIACITVLRGLADGDARLEAWANCFDGQLANLTDPKRLHDTVQSVERAAEVLAALDDNAGAAKAHGVRAQALARLGRIAECEAALDKALAAARQAGDLRRANSVLAGAPLAALWGPSPVARASGKCLDVVRVLRITSGSPAVEATALRCQAVLEALRGRDDAARRMLAAARASLEELGLRSGLLETDLFAGIIDLLADRPADAEVNLRGAYDGFRELGVDIDAAQSAALLARALLALGRDEEALELTQNSELHGGEDLKTAIAWRSARAEVLAGRGDIDEALQLARHAVTLAEPTDLVIDHADSCTALAAVLRSAGRVAEATDQARRAAELYERKGATAAGQPAPAVRGAAPEPIQGDRVKVPPNRASQAQDRLFDLAKGGRWSDIDDVLADGLVIEERAFGGMTQSRAEFIDDLKYVFAVRVDTRAEVLATRGDSLALERLTWRGEHPASGSFAVEKLAVIEASADGRMTWSASFDPADLASATVELDRRYLEGEAAHVAGEFAAIQRWIALYNQRDWHNYRDVWTDGFRVVDHRPAGWGDIDGDTYVDVLRGMVELAPDIGATILTADVAQGRGRTLIQAAGTSVTGGPLEIHLEMTYEIRAARLARVDIYAPGRRDAGRDPLWNAAAAATKASREAGARGRWDVVAALHSADSRLEDRRAGLNTVVIGRDAIVEESRFAHAHVTFTNEIIATRGDKVVLALTSWTGDAEGDYLSINEVDDDGLIVLRIRFDAFDLDAAFDELDATFERLQPSYAAMRRFNRAVNERDWAGLRDVFAEDFLLIDRPTAGSRPLNREQSVDNYRAVVELAPDMRVRVVSTLAFTEQGGIGVAAFEGPGLAGGATDFGVVGVAMVRGDQFTRFEIFDRDDTDGALRRFEELTAGARSIDITNRAVEVLADIERAAVAHDWDRAMSFMAPDVQLVDRRIGLRTVQANAENLRRDLQLIYGTRRDSQIDVLAVRGTRLLLRRCVLIGADDYDNPFEVAFLQVAAINDQDRVAVLTNFDVDDRDAAISELDARYIAGEAAPFADNVRLGITLIDCLARADYDGIASLLAPGYEMIDRFDGSPLGALDRGAWLAYLGATPEVFASIRTDVVSYHRLGQQGAVVETVSTVDLDGAPAEWWEYDVVLIADGLITHIERFGRGQLDEAVRRYDELTAAEGSLVENAVTRIYAPLSGPDWVARRWDYFESSHAGDLVLEARNAAGIRYRFEGRDAAMAEGRSLSEQGMTTIAVEPVAIRGDRLALVRFINTGEVTEHAGGPAAFEELAVCETNDAGLISRVIVFEAGDFEIALAELDNRYAELTRREPLTTVERAIAAFTRASTARDVDAVRRLIHPDHVNDDRRSGLRVRLEGSGASANNYQLMMDLGVGDIRGEILATRGDRLALTRATISGTGLSGDGTADVEYLTLVEVDADGRMTATTTFDADDYGAAELELDERYLQGEGRDQPAAIWQAALLRALYERDWDAYAALISDDFEFVDHGPYKVPPSGRDEFVRQQRTLMEVPGTRVRTLAVLELRPTGMLYEPILEGPDLGGSRVEAHRYGILIVDGPVCTRIETFAADALADARARFDELTVGDAGLDQSTVTTALLLIEKSLAALNARDLAAFAATQAADVAYIDCRPGMRTTVVGREALDSMRFVAGHNTTFAYEVIATFGDLRVLTRQTIRGRDRFDAEFETVVLSLAEVNAEGLCTRSLSYDESQLEEALAQLRASPPEQVKETPATRAGAALRDAIESGSRAALEALIAERAVMEDERWRVVHEGRDAIINNFLSIGRGVAIDRDLIAIRGDDISLIRLRTRDADDRLGSFEVEFFCLGEYRDGQLVRLKYLVTPDIDEAIAELDDWYEATLRKAGPTSPFEDAVRAISDAMNAGAPEPFVNLLADGLVVEDHVNHRTIDQAEYADIVRRMARMPGVKMVYTPMVALGRRHGLARAHYTYPAGSARGPWAEVGGGETIFLVVERVDEHGRVLAHEHFADGNLLDALIRLEELYQEDEAEGDDLVASEIRLNGWKATQALALHDWEAAVSAFSPDFGLVDHTPGGLSSVESGEAMMDSARFFTGLGSDFNVGLTAIHYYGRWSTATTNVNHGTDAYGGSFEMEFALATKMSPRGIERIELFAPDAIDEAIAVAKAMDS